MKKEVSDALFDFFQEFLKPELDEIKEKQSQYDGRFLDMLGHFDGVYKKLENLEVEYHSIVAGMDRLEKTQDRQGEQLSAKLDSVADDLTAHLRDTWDSGLPVRRSLLSTLASAKVEGPAPGGPLRPQERPYLRVYGRTSMYLKFYPQNRD